MVEVEHEAGFSQTMAAAETADANMTRLRGDMVPP